MKWLVGRGLGGEIFWGRRPVGVTGDFGEGLMEEGFSWFGAMPSGGA